MRKRGKKEHNHKRFSFLKSDKENIIISTKGLSAIVSTLIIILLVLVAAGVIWVVVRGIVQEGAEGIELGKFTLDLEIKAAQIEDGDVTVVVVRRNPGQGNFVGMNFIFSDGTNSEIIREDTVLDELDERSFTFTLTKINTEDLETISVAPIFELSSGKESVGNVADSFEVTEEMKAGITGGAVIEGPFAELGFTGMGTVNYSVSSGGADKLPVIERVIVDPLDVHVGDTQTFIAYVTSPYNITEVVTRTQLDNELLVLPLEKTENENEYLATWEVYDTHTTIYRTNFTARDSEGNENMVTVSWTDPCTSLSDHGTNKEISTSCTVGVSGIDGLDEGNITLTTGGSITMNGGTFIRTLGYSMIFSGGTLNLQGGEVREAYLYYNDADQDSYGSGYDWYSSPTYAGHTRANAAVGESDCNDGDVNVWTYGYGIDNDGDNYGQSTYGCNNGAAPRTATSGTDCCDSDANAKPGQTSYFTTARTTCGGYDYNCDSSETKQWTLTTGACTDCELFETCEEWAGTIGWVGSSAPACGVQYYYITDEGYCPARCVVEGCIEESRTQACR